MAGSILDKPQGMTSTQAVGAVRRIFDAQKAGHAGTLDPMATGILAIALGEATKTVPYAMDAEKIYRFTATWGESARQRRCRRQGHRHLATSAPSRDEIEAMLPRFTGALIPGPAGLFRHQGRRASGPMIWPGRGRRSSWNPARSRSSRPGCSGSRTRTMPSSKSFVAKALTSGPGSAIWPWRWALWAMFRPLRRTRHGRFRRKRRGRAGYPDPFYA